MKTASDILRSIKSNQRRRQAQEPSVAMETLEDRQLLTMLMVTSVADTGTGTLREAIDLANANPGSDVIRFSNDMTGQRIGLESPLPEITDPLMMRGPVNSMDAIIIDGQYNWNDRALITVDEAAGKVTIKNMTITRGLNLNDIGAYGGALLNEGPDTLLVRVKITDNLATRGGGIYNGELPSLGNGDPTGVSPQLTMKMSEVSNNFATEGGGIWNSAAMTIELSDIVSNQATDGGGIQASGSLTTTHIIASTLDNNQAEADGGAINSFLSDVRIDLSTIAHNRAGGSGGGIKGFGGRVVLRTSTMAFNTSENGFGGGAIRMTTSATGEPRLVLRNATIVRNVDMSSNAKSAGGISQDGGNLSIRNSIVSLNFSGGDEADINHDGVGAGYTDVGNVFGYDPHLGPLQDNGGPTHTMMPYTTSIALDNGRDFSILSFENEAPLSTDQRGFERNIEANIFRNGRKDVGAVEYNPSGVDQPIVTGADAGDEPRVTVYNDDGTVRRSFLAFDANFTGGVRVAMGDVNGDGVQDIIAGMGQGDLPKFKVFDGVTGGLIATRRAFETTYDGGINVASADLNNDGFADIIVTPDGGRRTMVKVFSGADVNVLLYSFDVTNAADRNASRVAVGDVSGDGVPDIIATSGNRVKVFNGDDPTEVVLSMRPFGQNFAGDLYVASGYLDGDQFADIIVGRGEGGNGRVKLYSGEDELLIDAFLVGDADSTSGVRVAARDFDGDGLSEIITARGPQADSVIRVFDGATRDAFTAFTDEFLTDNRGLFVAGESPKPVGVGARVDTTLPDDQGEIGDYQHPPYVHHTYGGHGGSQHPGHHHHPVYHQPQYQQPGEQS